MSCYNPPPRHKGREAMRYGLLAVGFIILLGLAGRIDYNTHTVTDQVGNVVAEDTAAEYCERAGMKLTAYESDGTTTCKPEANQ